jgi:hypothetical protein
MGLNKLAAFVVAAAMLLVACDSISILGCGTPGVKRTHLKVRALAERLQPRARITGRCPTTKDLRQDDVDAWNRRFIISCEEGDPPWVVVRSLGADGMLGTADDIRSESAAQQAVAADGAAPRR